MSAEPKKKPRSIDLFYEDPFERIMAILIALVTLLATIAGFLQTDAAARSDHANRDAQRFAIEAMGRRIDGGLQVAYDWNDAYQTWDVLDTLALSASGDDEAAVTRYETLQDKVAALSPLLQTPYFDPASDDEPDLAGYEADTYLVDATALTERYTWAARLDNAWSDKANSYVTHLTLLSVTLFLFGLSITIAGVTRWLFVGAGLFLTMITVIWMLIIFVRPVPTMSPDAITAYAQGVGLIHRDDMEEAVTAFDQALAEAPTYANALYERGNAHYNLAHYKAAAADYEAAWAAGKENTNIGHNLGWTYYLLGLLDRAIEIDHYTLAQDGHQIGTNFNLALALLADGQLKAAQAEFTNGMDQVQRQVIEAREAGLEPPSSLWWYLDAAVRDLDGLIDRLDGTEKEWTEAPPRKVIAEPDKVKALAQKLAIQIRELAVALEYTGQPPQADSTIETVHVSPFQFGQSEYDDEGNFVEYQLAESFPYLTDEVLVLFDYEGLHDGQSTTWKVYKDGWEDPSLRLREEWALDETGSAEKPLSYAYSSVFVFSPGRYDVELYIDSHLVQRGSFIIEEPE